ncbi:MAG: hypothetical protein M3443_01490 [Actinomycetota bacterium]|nr:hypothetical protein [Actinomycetota bacterium]
MWITLAIAHAVWEWLPNLTTVLRLGSATFGFGIAVHRAIRYLRQSRER